MTRKGFLAIAIATLITVIAWVGFDIYFKRQKAEIPKNVQEQIEPITTNFDTSGVE